VVPENKVADQSEYPFVVFKVESPYNRQYRTYRRTTELFDINISFSCYAEYQGEALSISDDLRTLFFDPKYHQQLRNVGVAPVDAINNSIRNEALTSFMPISIAGFDLTVRLVRGYTSDYPTVTQVNQKGSVEENGN
jgi:hypothetical protein